MRADLANENLSLRRDLGRTINERDDARRGLASARSRADNAEAALWRVREFCRGVDENPGDGKVWAAAVLELLAGEACDVAQFSGGQVVRPGENLATAIETLLAATRLPDADFAAVYRRARGLADLAPDPGDREFTAFQRAARFIITGEKLPGDPTRDVED